MKCPICGGRMYVYSLRVSGFIVIRYRVCRNCGHHKKTVEE